MTSNPVADALSGALSELGIETREMDPGMRLYEDLGLDSTEMVMVTLELTRRLGVRVKLASKTDLTFAQACETVTRQVGATP
jgi:acyl carrier protein